MISNNPIVSENQTYDKFSVNLALTSNYNKNEEMDLSIALRIIPTKIDNEVGGLTLDNQAYTIYRGKLNELKDEAEQNCINTIISALQQLINNRGW